MVRWTRVKWTEAHQVTEQLDWPLEDAASAHPETYFESLRGSGRLHDAACFLAQALPRHEAVAWAARVVRDLKPGGEPGAADALKAALLWVQDPSETRRRAAWNASELAPDDSPERFAALAAFFSGGSIAPPDCAPVPAPRDTAARFAAAAVLLAAIRSGDQEVGLGRALDAGDSLAASGVQGPG
jgi:hypothetical protein